MTSLRSLIPASVAVALAAAVLTGTHAPSAYAAPCPTAAASYASGTGTSADPYVIALPSQLQRLNQRSADWTKSFRLLSDINMGGCTWTSPIGTPATAYSGLFDGDNHVISQLSITTTNQTHVGLFGYVAYPFSGIQDLGFTGTVSNTFEYYYQKTIYVGGLVGYLGPFSMITGSFATGAVSGTLEVEDDDASEAIVFAGGLAGGSQGLVSNSYATGSVYGSATATGDPTGDTTSMERRAIAHVGGLIGVESPAGNTSRTFSVGQPTFSTVSLGGNPNTTLNYIGGLIGTNNATLDGSAGNLWNTESSLKNVGAGAGSTVGMSGKTTADMKSLTTFSTAGWDIGAEWDPAKVWGICSGVNNGYPFQTGFYSSDPCGPPTITAIQPAVGPPDGGTSVTITGTRLQGAAVTFGGDTVTPTTTTATSATFLTPQGSVGPVTITVTTAGGSYSEPNAFAYESPPVVPDVPSNTSNSSSQAESAPLTSPTQSQSAPEPRYVDIVPGALTTAPSPNSATTLVDGNPVPSNVTQSGGTTTVTTPAAGTSFSVTPPSRAGELVSGLPVRFGFNGGMPGSPVTVYAMSTPVLVATATADASGNVSGYITVPATLPAGRHTLVVSGYTATGAPVSSYLGVEVVAPKSAVKGRILFDYGSSALTKRAKEALRRMASRVQGAEASGVVVGSIRSGASPADRALARARAKAVADFLRSAGFEGAVRVGTSVPTRLTTARARGVDVTVTS